MKVKARYFAAVREIVGRNEEDFEVPDQTTVRDFLHILSERYGEPLREYVFSKDTGELSPPLELPYRREKHHYDEWSTNGSP